MKSKTAKKEPITKNTIVIVVLMIIIGVCVMLSVTIIPWIGEINRSGAVVDIKTDVNNHVTEENNELAGIILDTFKENRGYGRSEHFNQSQMLAEIVNNIADIKRLLSNGTS